MKTLRTYILIADEKEARLLENSGVGQGVHQISYHSADDSGVVPADFAGKRGSGQGASGQARHGFDAETTKRENARNMFAKYLAGVIKKENTAGNYDQLVLCAPPQLLGELRSKLDGNVEVFADLNKNLMGIATDDLPKHLTSIVKI